MATPSNDPDEPYRAYDTGYIGADPESGFTAGGHGAYKLGKADREAGRSHANRGDIAKSYHKASRAAAPPNGGAGTPSNDDPQPSSPAPSTGDSRRGRYFARSNKVMSKPIGQTGAPVFSHIARGDGTGLVLAIVLYPLLLSIIKYGAKGPGLYFQAKWLNKTPAAPASATTSAAVLPANASQRQAVTV